MDRRVFCREIISVMIVGSGCSPTLVAALRGISVYIQRNTDDVVETVLASSELGMARWALLMPHNYILRYGTSMINGYNVCNPTLVLAYHRQCTGRGDGELTASMAPLYAPLYSALMLADHSMVASLLDLYYEIYQMPGGRSSLLPEAETVSYAEFRCRAVFGAILLNTDHPLWADMLLNLDRRYQIRDILTITRYHVLLDNIMRSATESYLAANGVNLDQHLVKVTVGIHRIGYIDLLSRSGCGDFWILKCAARARHWRQYITDVYIVIARQNPTRWNDVALSLYTFRIPPITEISVEVSDRMDMLLDARSRISAYIAERYA